MSLWCVAVRKMWWLYAALAYAFLYAYPALARKILSKASPPPRVVLVTGASGGLGKLTAEAIAKEYPNCFVYGTSRNAAEPAAGAKAAKVGEVKLLKLDVCKQDSVEACVEGIIGQHGHIDVLINNAGICWSTKAATTTADDAEVSTPRTAVPL